MLISRFSSSFCCRCCCCRPMCVLRATGILGFIENSKDTVGEPTAGRAEFVFELLPTCVFASSESRLHATPLSLNNNDELGLRRVIFICILPRQRNNSARRGLNIEVIFYSVQSNAARILIYFTSSDTRITLEISLCRSSKGMVSSFRRLHP